MTRFWASPAGDGDPSLELVPGLYPFGQGIAAGAGQFAEGCGPSGYDEHQGFDRALDERSGAEFEVGVGGGQAEAADPLPGADGIAGAGDPAGREGEKLWIEGAGLPERAEDIAGVADDS